MGNFKNVIVADSTTARLFALQADQAANTTSLELVKELTNEARRQTQSERYSDSRPGTRQSTGTGHGVDDHRDAHSATAERLNHLFCGPPDALGEYGLGRVRSLAEFERHAGIRLRRNGGHRFEIDRSVIEPRDDYDAFVLVFLDAQGAELARTEVRDPDVLDLSRPNVMLHNAPVADAVSYLVVPTQRNGTIGEVVLRPL